MNEKKPARGSATRTANMNKRREQILTRAGSIIAKEGFEALTLNRLALESNVTVPTIHNLVGKKSDIFKQLVEQVVESVEQALIHQDISDPITAAETSIDKLMELYSSNEDLYKAAFVAGERAKIFEHELPTGIFSKSLQLTINVCNHGIQEGYLEGNIDPIRLAHELFGCQRLARHDWVQSYIDLDSYRNQVLIGMFILFAADASPAYRKQLLAKIESLQG